MVMVVGWSGLGIRWVALSAVLALATSSRSARADEAPAQAAPAQPTEVHHGSAFVDPLGFALFGPRFGVEAGKQHLSGALYARWFGPGLLAHSLFLKAGDRFGFSYGAGARGRYYFGENLDGVHLGLAAELLHTRVENEANLIATGSSYLVPYAEAGYRLALGNFYGDASAGFGYAARLSSSVENLPGGTSAAAFAVEDQSTVYGVASLDLGIFF